VRKSLTVMPKSLTMFVIGNETPFRQKEKVGLVLCFLTNIVSLILVISNDGWQWFCTMFSHVRGQTV